MEDSDSQVEGSPPSTLLDDLLQGRANSVQKPRRRSTPSGLQSFVETMSGEGGAGDDLVRDIKTKASEGPTRSLTFFSSRTSGTSTGPRMGGGGGAAFQPNPSLFGRRKPKPQELRSRSSSEESNVSSLSESDPVRVVGGAVQNLGHVGGGDSTPPPFATELPTEHNDTDDEETPPMSLPDRSRHLLSPEISAERKGVRDLKWQRSVSYCNTKSRAHREKNNVHQRGRSQPRPIGHRVRRNTLERNFPRMEDERKFGNGFDSKGDDQDSSDDDDLPDTLPFQMQSTASMVVNAVHKASDASLALADSDSEDEGEMPAAPPRLMRSRPVHPGLPAPVDNDMSYEAYVTQMEQLRASMH